MKQDTGSESKSAGAALNPALAALEQGRSAFSRRAWAEAYAALVLADQAAPLQAADLDRLAQSAALSGHDEDALRSMERLYQARLDGGEGLLAARIAFWLSMRLAHLGDSGRASGWLGRARRLVEREGENCVEHGYLFLPVIQRSLAAGDWAAAQEVALRAAAIGDRFLEVDLSAFARGLHSRALLRQGLVREGLALLDEVMVTIETGEPSPIVAGLIYCAAIASCQHVLALSRAREWTAALSRWCDAQPQLVTFTGACLVHRAEIQQLAGAWPEAIEEARRVSSRSSPATPVQDRANALYQEAEIQRLRGELTAAEQSYRSASELGREPHPGLGLLRIAQGRCDAAASGIRRALATTSDPLARLRLLPASVEILLASGALEEARAAATELEELAARFDTAVIAALAALARGAVLLAQGDAAAALAPLRRGFAVWQEVDAPYLAAQARVLLGRACRALGDHDGAAFDLGAARAVFVRLGAAIDLSRVDELLQGVSPTDRHGLSARELEVLRHVAAGKTNKAIAKELFLSEKTVDRHVSNIFAKLNVASRAAATAFAYEHKLV